MRDGAPWGSLGNLVLAFNLDDPTTLDPFLFGCEFCYHHSALHMDAYNGLRSLPRVLLLARLGN